MFKNYHLPTVIFGTVTTILIQSQPSLGALSTEQIDEIAKPIPIVNGNLVVDNNLTAEDYLQRAVQKYKKKDYQGAIADYTQAIKINPQDARAYLGRGSTYGLLRKYGEVRRDFQQAANLYQQQGNNAKYQQIMDLLNELPR